MRNIYYFALGILRAVKEAMLEIYYDAVVLGREKR